MDAPELYELARDPRIGTLCGWKPFECIDDAHEALSTVLAAPRQLRGGACIDR